jgi:TorA maturation chaperone TorD
MAILDLRSSILEVRVTREQVMERLSKSAETTDPIDLAYCRAALYSALMLGFQPPTDETLSRLLARDSRSSLAHAASILYPAQEPKLICKVEALPNTEETDTATLASRYRLFFGHSARGQIPPYETEYGSQDLFRQAQELADAAGFFRAFGLAIPESRRERSDHVSAECEFLSFLAFKEAYDLTRGETNSVEEIRRVEGIFLKDHLGRFVRAFAREVAHEARHPLYRALGELCFRFLTIECRAAGVAPGPQFLALRSDREDDVPMACGSSCPLVPKGQEPDEDS